MEKCTKKRSYVRATLAFQSGSPEEMSLSIGDVMKLLQFEDTFWYYGQKLKNGIKGQFPKGFVEPVVIPIISSSEQVLFALEKNQSPYKDELNFMQGEIIVLERTIDENWAFGRCEKKLGVFPIACVQKIATNFELQKPTNAIAVATAIMPMRAQQANELSFVVDDLIYILEKIDDEWAKGQVNEHVGIFPLSFTEQICNFQQLSISTTTAGKFSSNKPIDSGLNTKLDDKDVMVIHSFLAKNEFELNVETGMTVRVMKQINDKWCKVKYKNRLGFIPISCIDETAITFTDTTDQRCDIFSAKTAIKKFVPPTSNECQWDTKAKSFDQTQQEECNTNLFPDAEKQLPTTEIKTTGKTASVTRDVFYSRKTNPSDQLYNDFSDKQTDEMYTRKEKSYESHTNAPTKATDTNKPIVQEPIKDPQPIRNLQNNVLSQKKKIEQIRTDIEECSRQKEELEVLYNSSFDGKERLTIAENKEIVMVRLKRLQKELEDLIYVTDNIYESVDVFRPVEGSHESRPPPTPPSVEKLEELKQRQTTQRQHVIKELIDTEQDFLKGTEITIDDIWKPLSQQELPLDVNIDVLFGNIEQIRDFSSKLLASLKEENQISNVGAIFIKHIPEMKEVYKMYCRNHDDATAMLEKIEDDVELCSAVEICLNNVKMKVNTFDLGSFLIKPVQRILKYPLLLNELLKLTASDGPNNSHADLIQAQKMMQEVANSINEDKRRKDLVRKYRKGSQETLSGKISRLSLHSVKKKSARISLRIGHATGLGNTETQDEKFNDVSRKFKDLERAVKDFTHNVENFGSRCKEWLQSELLVYEDLSELFASDSSATLTQLSTTQRRISEQIYGSFHDQVQLRVLSPLTSLLARFRGPQAIIEKRFDKLLDFENCQKNRESQEKIQMAKNVYEALNQQLLDELPQLCELSKSLLQMCSTIFVELYIEFQKDTEEELASILALLTQTESLMVTEPVQDDFEKAYRSLHNQAIIDLSQYSIVPPSFGALTTSLRRISNGSFNKVKPVKDEPSSPHLQQSLENRNLLISKFSPESLYVANQQWQPNNEVDLHCNVNELLAVMKKQDPMGNTDRWFVDSGVVKGFVPVKILSPYTQPTYDSVYSPPHDACPYTNVSSPSTLHIPDTETAGSNVSSNSSQHSSALQDPYSDEDEMLDDLEYGEISHKQYYRVEYDFTARSTLELSVKSGEILTLIVSRDLEGNEEWWLMSNSSGHQGYVPSNYMIKAEYL
uniref:Dynamin-binding protein n=1 Tax=Phallusia mammillata TaxID=59560 RepID=A0A6F9DAJ7_9ASCI|nr:dynamin-binding protein-like [Phallusia mammillata]